MFSKAWPRRKEPTCPLTGRDPSPVRQQPPEAGPQASSGEIKARDPVEDGLPQVRRPKQGSSWGWFSDGTGSPTWASLSGSSSPSDGQGCPHSSHQGPSPRPGNGRILGWPFENRGVVPLTLANPSWDQFSTEVGKTHPQESPAPWWGQVFTGLIL